MDGSDEAILKQFSVKELPALLVRDLPPPPPPPHPHPPPPPRPRQRVQEAPPAAAWPASQQRLPRLR
jgi:hypothetical protein